MGIHFDTKAFNELCELAVIDIKSFKKIDSLIKSIQREGMLKGIGHPERLKHINGYSRKIDDKNRLIYRIDENGSLCIVSCKGHYED
jgi:toxin YoeB